MNASITEEWETLDETGQGGKSRNCVRYLKTDTRVDFQYSNIEGTLRGLLLEMFPPEELRADQGGAGREFVRKEVHTTVQISTADRIRFLLEKKQGLTSSSAWVDFLCDRKDGLRKWEEATVRLTQLEGYIENSTMIRRLKCERFAFTDEDTGVPTKKPVFSVTKEGNTIIVTAVHPIKRLTNHEFEAAFPKKARKAAATS